MGKQILLLGIGEVGCTVADLFSRRMRKAGLSAEVLAVDTDERTLSAVTDAKTVPMVNEGTLGDVLDTLDPEVLKRWFPCDREKDGVEFFEGLPMDRGTSQWRMKALLSMTSFLSDGGRAQILTGALDALLGSGEAPAEGPDGSEAAEKDGAPAVELYTVASLSGGTGSGLFVPLTLYVKRYLEEHGASVERSTAMLVFPDVYEDLLTAEQRVKAQANAYAALRELHAIDLTGETGSEDPAFSIGAEDDPYLGLLFDTSRPEFADRAKKPFGRVYLFRRIPGVRQTGLYPELIAETVELLASGLLGEPERPSGRSSELKSNEAIYAGVTLSKTVYPAESIVSYIALRTALEKVDGELTLLSRAVDRDRKRCRRESVENGTELDDTAAVYVDAILRFADDLVGESESDSAVLGRTFEHPEDDTAPLTRLPEEYAEQVLKTVDGEFRNGGAREIEAFLREQDDLEARIETEKIRLTKRSRPQRDEFESNAEVFGEWITSYYRDGMIHLKNEADAARERFRAGLDPATGGIASDLLKDEGTFVHPVLALVRLVALYREINEALAPLRTFYGDPAHPMDTADIPAWVLQADSHVYLSCRYARQGGDRFSRLISGEKRITGGAVNDERLFAFDLRTVYDRIRESFRLSRAELLLEVLGERILAYYGFLRALESELRELPSDVEGALRGYTGDNALVYYVGTSAEQKRAAYDAYGAFLADRGLKFPYLRKEDAELGEFVASHLGESDAPHALVGCIADSVRTRCRESGFYGEVLDRNVLEVLTSEEKPDLALRKAFLPRSISLRYTVPREGQMHLALRAIGKSTAAMLPKEAEEYIAERPERFDGRAGERAILGLFSGAGDEGNLTVSFCEGLPKDTLQMLRETSALKLSYIEAVNERSEEPLYYRSYRKALMMREQQLTDLWDPHLVRGLSEEGRLPYVAPPTETAETE